MIAALPWLALALVVFLLWRHDRDAFRANARVVQGWTGYERAAATLVADLRRQNGLLQDELEAMKHGRGHVRTGMMLIPRRVIRHAEERERHVIGRAFKEVRLKSEEG